MNLRRRELLLLATGAAALSTYAALFGVQLLASHLEAVRNRAWLVLENALAEPERRPCTICGGAMRLDRETDAIEWRRCASPECGRSVAAVPWRALVAR